MQSKLVYWHADHDGSLAAVTILRQALEADTRLLGTDDYTTLATRNSPLCLADHGRVEEHQDLADDCRRVLGASTVRSIWRRKPRNSLCRIGGLARQA